MEYLISYIKVAIFTLLLGLTGCATTGQGGVSSERINDKNSVKIEQSSSDSLTDHLRRIVGVKVVGDGPSARIIIREKSSFTGDTTPLFVINGIRAGKDFASIYNLISPSDIVEIEVLKGTDTSLYGMDGANGVILINTRGS